MAFFEQAAVLSTAWANNEELKGHGAKNSLCIVRSKKLKRGFLNANMSSLQASTHAMCVGYKTRRPEKELPGCGLGSEGTGPSTQPSDGAPGNLSVFQFDFAERARSM